MSVSKPSGSRSGTKEFEETASSLVRGLKVVGMEQKANEKIYTVVYRWDARSIVAVGKIDFKLNKPVDAAELIEPKNNQPMGREQDDPQQENHH